MSFKLLPKSTEEFSDAKFWEGFFKTRGSRAFEWYGEYQDMLELWAQYVKKGDRVLNIGCGNSELGAELHDRQGCEVLCIDTSATVVQQMSRKHCANGRRPRLTYRVMDAAKLEGLESGGFACAIDKGTLDALMSASASLANTVDAMLVEAHRVLRVGGRHLIVTLCQRQVVDKLVEHITLRPWIARVHQATAASATEPGGFPLPVFFVALTKLRDQPAVGPLGTLVQAQDAYSTGPPERLDSVQLLADWIRRIQLTAYSLARQTGGNSVGEGDSSGDGRCRETQFAYACGRTGLAAFACRLLAHTAPGRRRTGYAVFIEGLDSEATTPAQRRDILESQAALRRMLFVRLHPWLHYESDAALQASLSRLVMAFAPRPGMPESEVAFLSAGRQAYPYQTVARAGRHLVEESDGREVRILCPDSDLAPLQCRASAESLKVPRLAAATSKGADSLARLLDALIGEAGDESADFVNWPCDLSWTLLSRKRPRLHRLSAASSSGGELLGLLADRLGLDYRTVGPLPNDSRLVVLFPPADSLAAYTAALSRETLAGLAEAVKAPAGGRLLVASRLFNQKAAALEANATALQALRLSGRFDGNVVSATFSCVSSDGEDEVGEGGGEDGEQLRYWVACASGTAESATRAADIIARLPGVVLVSH